MRVCVVGGGGREHALASVLGCTADVVVTPGNPGIPGSTDAPASEIEADLFVIGPEQPIVDGLGDELRAAGKLVFAPGADGAQLEASKAWMKSFLADAGVPTAAHGTFTEVEPALEFLRTLPGLYVVKTDGLAAGKGVFVTENLIDAEDDVRAKLSGGSFGEAGRTVVIEEGMVGPELSLLVVCDGSRLVPLAPAQDFKRVGDGDAGPNTGGMGAYSPVPVAGPDVVDEVMASIIEPTLGHLQKLGIDYRGVLYAGLMLTPSGPKTVEYNVRFGDPEAQAVLPRMRSDLAEMLAQAASGSLTMEPEFSDDACVTVVASVGGYPDSPHTGDLIEGIDDACAIDGVDVFFAGVSGSRDELRTAGGRVLSVSATGSTIAAARQAAYAAIGAISWRGMHHRTDIALAAST
jgi:phosphoribosylamine--glycine ligase